MSKVLIDRELLERAHSLLCSYCSTLENRAIVKQAISEISAILAQPAADCGLEVVAWRIGFLNGAGYKVYEQHQPWAYERYGTPPYVAYEVQDLIRKSDADALQSKLNDRRETVCRLLSELEKFRECFVIAVGDKSPFCRCALEPVDAALATYKGE